MIQTDTTWEDTGFDCLHCGGELLKRTDRETGLPDQVCYQCRECGCQWSLDGDIIRIGTGEYCKAAARRETSSSTPDMSDLADWAGMLSRSLWILLAIIAGFFLLRFGGGLVVRYVLPLIGLGIGAYVLLRYGRKQRWW
ncbi:MAG: hypothetical protein ACK2UK_05050 [Candidatus Promineifilaceae bacterium]